MLKIKSLLADEAQGKTLFEQKYAVDKNFDRAKIAQWMVDNLGLSREEHKIMEQQHQ